MAIGWIYLQYLQSKGIFLEGKASVLDIGCQHLRDIPQDQGTTFARSNGYSGEAGALDQNIEELVLSSKSPHWQAYLHDFLQLTSIRYVAYDIFQGPQTRIFDLNFNSLPHEDVAAFDVVLNFGTTEHVFNQYNCFKVIHEATKVGGFMFHQVPAVGYIDHGYWIYSPRTFSEVAQANRYEIAGFWITGPQGSDIFGDQAPGVWDRSGMIWDRSLPENNHEAWKAAPVPNGVVNVLLRKTKNDRFRLALDTTTTAADTDTNLASGYATE